MIGVVQSIISSEVIRHDERCERSMHHAYRYPISCESNGQSAFHADGFLFGAGFKVQPLIRFTTYGRKMGVAFGLILDRQCAYDPAFLLLFLIRKCRDVRYRPLYARTAPENIGHCQSHGIVGDTKLKLGVHELSPLLISFNGKREARRRRLICRLNKQCSESEQRTLSTQTSIVC